MYYPTTRVLTVLELLQSHGRMTGAQIAERLEVDIRTARRYIAMLEELGIPVTADRGPAGGYRLMPGFKLPPLMLNEDEALALTLGLLAARRLGLVTQAPGVEGALAKVERVLPDRIRDRVRAVEETVVWDIGRGRRQAEVDPGVILTLGTAARERRRVSLVYRRSDGDETERLFDPYGLACRRGKWYAVGYCHLRLDQRLFRLDRVLEARSVDEPFDRPADFDVLDAVVQSLGAIPRKLPLDVLIEAELEYVRWHVSASVAVLEECEGGVRLRGFTDSAPYMARLLSSMGKPLHVREPAELREELRLHAERILEWAVGS